MNNNHILMGELIILNPSVSVIVPVYNGGKTIEHCIQSILNQTYKNIYIIVIDDGSTDNTEKILNKYKNNSKIIILKEKNSGVSHARNVGLEKVKTDLISFVDSDDYIEPNFIKNMVDSLYTSSTDMCITGVNYIYSDVVRLSNYKKEIINKYDKSFWNTVLKSNGPMGFIWNKLWKTSVIKKNNITFDEDIKISEDLFFCIQYLYQIDNISIISDHGYNHYVKHKMSFKTSELYLKTLKKIRKTYLHKNDDLVENINAQISVGYINLIRKSCLNKKEVNNISEFKLQAKKYGKGLINSSYVTNTQKIAFILTLYFPSCMKAIDRMRS